MKTKVRTLNMGTVRVPIIEIVSPLPTFVYFAVEELQTLRATAVTFMTRLRRARAGVYTSIAFFAASIISLLALVIFKNFFENESTLHRLIHQMIADICITIFLLGLGLLTITWMIYPRIMLRNARLWRNWIALRRFIRNLDSQRTPSPGQATLTESLHRNPRCEKITVEIRNLKNEAIEDLRDARRKMKRKRETMSEDERDSLEWDIHLYELRVRELASVIREFNL